MIKKVNPGAIVGIILGVIIIGIVKTVYDKFSPIWKKWYQDMKRKKR